MKGALSKVKEQKLIPPGAHDLKTLQKTYKW